jgi:hypothetical protein
MTTLRFAGMSATSWASAGDDLDLLLMRSPTWLETLLKGTQFEIARLRKALDLRPGKSDRSLER